MTFDLASHPKLPGIALLSLGVGTLAFALIAEYGFGLEPCILCLYQRVPFAVVGALGLVAWLRPGWLLPCLWLAATALLINSGIAFYHTGVEKHWWASAAGCSGGATQANTTADLLAGIQEVPPKPCDAVDWTFLGVSFATYNIFYSGGLAVGVAFAARWLRQNRKQADS